jgi:glycerol-3-phosphate dehydrogenase (NAD(P)+)
LPSQTDHAENIAVLGAGSWGTTLARLLSLSGKHVCLWGRDSTKIEKLKIERKIERPLVATIPKAIEITSDLAAAVRNASIILICCTSQSMRPLMHNLREHVAARQEHGRLVLVSVVKGLELNTLKRMSEVINEIIPELAVCALSGPNLAAEMLLDLPTAAVVACLDASIASHVQKALSVPKFRIYSNTDIIGVELGGTLKNVIAIAAGGSDGLELGVNAKAALLTRGLAEMTRLSVSLGAKGSTLAGLAGMGDLVATCAGPMSRNYKLGMEMARGKSLEQIRQEVGAVIEGIPTTEAAYALSQKIGIDLPIAELVNSALMGLMTPEKAILSLMARPLARE